MAVTKAQKSGAPTQAPPMPPVQVSAATPVVSGNSANSKKKKKKKGKARAIAAAADELLAAPTQALQEDSIDDEDLPSLDPLKDPTGHYAGVRLDHELESVQFTVPASLSASAAAAARLNATAAAQAELLATANDLYRRIDADPSNGIADNDEYWSSLPSHIRNFVRLPHVMLM
jgi:hypothetical protein